MSSCICFYKGTAFPLGIIGKNICKDLFMKTANIMIVAGLQNGHSIEEQKVHYKKQLDKMESELCKLSGGKRLNNKQTKSVIDTLSKRMNMSIDAISTLWYLNVSALLKLKVIEDDNMNGFITMKGGNMEMIYPRYST